MEDIDDIEELHDLMSKLAEISKEFRHAHAELKCYLARDKYEADYSLSKGYSDSMRKFTKEAKEKIKKLKKASTLEVESKKYVLEDQYLCDKLDRMISKLVPEDISLISEIEQNISDLEFYLEEYYKIQSNLKTILGSDYDKEKLEKVQIVVEEKVKQCKDRILAIKEYERKLEEERMNEENSSSPAGKRFYPIPKGLKKHSLQLEI